MALEAIHGVLTVSELAQKYEVHPVQIAQWKKEVQLHASAIFEDDKKQRADILNMQNERNELFKQLGELKFQNEWLKKNCFTLIELSSPYLSDGFTYLWLVYYPDASNTFMCGGFSRVIVRSLDE